jgi:hypothetical protein
MGGTLQQSGERESGSRRPRFPVGRRRFVHGELAAHGVDDDGGQCGQAVMPISSEAGRAGWL